MAKGQLLKPEQIVVLLRQSYILIMTHKTKRRLLKESGQSSKATIVGARSIVTCK